ncbi:hypothetical protein Tsubulata_024091 [Turnera subulata]|uniref:DUF4283 domain-containing protein n=1 Tax=Turnera subulata TaxID=218843 RepID=A0A9Q0J931_9ROSI|nr:hypothetical protein Tsubulata_024091 [Turnera subulata]
MINKTCLVGKVYSLHSFTAGSVKSNLKRVWNLSGDFSVTEKGQNSFTVGFEFEADCDKIMRDVPWLMANCDMNFSRWSARMSINQIPMRLTVFWIQLYELPLECLDEYKIKKICNIFPTWFEIDDRLESIMGWNGFVRVKIEFLPERAFIPGIHFYDSLGEKVWIKIRYERLGEFCVNCRRITHNKRNCSRLGRIIEKEEKESIHSVGPWLRARESIGKSWKGKKTIKVFSLYKPSQPEEPRVPHQKVPTEQ